MLKKHDNAERSENAELFYRFSAISAGSAFERWVFSKLPEKSVEVAGQIDRFAQ
jgi:hypothetical protein